MLRHGSPNEPFLRGTLPKMKVLVSVDLEYKHYLLGLSQYESEKNNKANLDFERLV